MELLIFWAIKAGVAYTVGKAVGAITGSEDAEAVAKAATAIAIAKSIICRLP